MKKTFLLLAAASLLLASCATVQENIDARAYLAKCKYQFAGLAITGVSFDTGTVIDRVDSNVFVKITDTTDRDVALDHAQFAFYLDDNHVLDAAHERFVRIPSGTSHTSTVVADLPFAGVLSSLGHRPKMLGIHAKLWVTLLVGKSNWVTPIVIPLNVEIPIPWDKIDAYVAQRGRQLAAQAQARAAASVKKAVPQVQLPPVKAPSLPSLPPTPKLP